MKILNIEENVKVLTQAESANNLLIIKENIRNSLERGEAPKIKSYDLSLILLQEQEKLKKWIGNFTDFTFLKKFLAVNLNEIIYHNHQNITLKGPQSVSMKELMDIDAKDFELMTEWLARKYQKDFNHKNPFTSFNCELDFFRLRITLAHKSINNHSTHKIFIRLFNKPKLVTEDFISNADLLKNMVLAKKNILFVGATGSGKTSLMQTLLKDIPKEEHLITIEDTHEIKAFNQNTTQLISRKGVSLDDLLSFSLRMTPDRIILGEIRSHEVITALLAINTGHKGLMTSLHANSALDAFYRLALLFSLYSNGNNMSFEDILKMIVLNIDHVVFLNNKKVFEVLSPLGVEGRDIYYDKVFSLE